MAHGWTAVPPVVAREILQRAGGSDITPAATGNHAELAVSVGGPNGSVFVKGASSPLGVRSLRYEVQVNRNVDRRYAPAVLWDLEAHGWLVAGFEHCNGRPGDLSPGSCDLTLLSSALPELVGPPASGGPWLSPHARLGFDHPALHGDTLVHTDLNPANLIVTADGLRIVDWAFTTQAAPWLELAMLAPWLIGSGHTPLQAEQWLAQHPTWADTDPEVVDLFVTGNAAKWARKSQQSNAAWIRDLASWFAAWSAHRGQTT